jgi:hypothetical protein
MLKKKMDIENLRVRVFGIKLYDIWVQDKLHNTSKLHNPPKIKRMKIPEELKMSPPMINNWITKDE